MTQQAQIAARQLYRSGRLREALDAFRALTDSEPADPQHWQFRAMTEQQVGSLAEARSSIARAIALDELRPEPHLVAGHISQDLGDFERAEAGFRRALELRPAWTGALNSLGQLMMARGRHEEALGTFQQSVAADGKAASSWNGLGVASLALERLPEAIRAFDYAVSLQPTFSSPHFNLARVYEMLGQNERALAEVRVAVQLDPRNSEFRLFLGRLLRQAGDSVGARKALTEATEVVPGHPQSEMELADLEWELGNEDAAVALFQAVSIRHPQSFRAAAGSNLVLPQAYDSGQALLEAREGYRQGLSALFERESDFRWSSIPEALQELTWTNFHLAYQGQNDLELQRGYGELVETLLRGSAPELLATRTRRAGAGRLRVGFFSHFFFSSTVGRYFASWIRDLDKSRFETVVLHTNPRVSEDTRAISLAADRFYHVPARSLHILARTILAEDLDILVYPELGMNAAAFTLASLRLAPVQVAGWGHPTTTGLPAIDWFLSCAEMEPANGASHYTERLATLPGLGTRYSRPGPASELSREAFGFAPDDHLYLVPQSLFKIHPDNDAVFAEILTRDAAARLVMFESPRKAVTERFRQRLGSLVSRVTLLPFQPHADFLAINAFCDVMLDTLHWSGGNTSLDALSVGLPVVTLPGELMRGRQSMAMLRMAGVPELIAGDVDAYIDTAIALASNHDQRDQTSRRIVANLGEIFDRHEPVRAFEDFLERVAGDRSSTA